MGKIYVVGKYLVVGKYKMVYEGISGQFRLLDEGWDGNWEWINNDYLVCVRQKFMGFISETSSMRLDVYFRNQILF